MISDLGIPKGSPNNSSNRANYINNTLMARFMVQLGFNFCISKKIVEILSGGGSKLPLDETLVTEISGRYICDR